MLPTGRRRCYHEDKHCVKDFLHSSLPTAGGFVCLSPSLCLVLSSCVSRRVVFVLRAVMEELGHFALAPHKAWRTVVSDGSFVWGALPCSNDMLGSFSDSVSHSTPFTSCHSKGQSFLHPQSDSRLRSNHFV